MLSEPYPYHNNGLFSPLLSTRDFAARWKINIGVIRTVRDFLLFYVTPSCVICYLISEFVFSLVTLSGATTVLFEAQQLQSVQSSPLYSIVLSVI